MESVHGIQICVSLFRDHLSQHISLLHNVLALNVNVNVIATLVLGTVSVLLGGVVGLPSVREKDPVWKLGEAPWWPWGVLHVVLMRCVTQRGLH